MRSLKEALLQYGIFIKKKKKKGGGGNLNIKTDRENAVEDEGRNQGNAFTSQEMPKIGSKQPESSREHGTESPAQPSERIKPH